ncbi:MAG TPA: adenylate/guanylate cyclase domain-containing protein [Acetobacteraceae bacterium]|nr:adenylate/guanylate cyclase domain-containing protein [Acetobacteraceae bacterium]
MPTEEVVDLNLASSHTERKRLWLRIGAPIGGVALVIAAILAIALYTNRVNRAGVLALSDNLLSGLQARIAQQVSDYLDPATRAALLARDMAAGHALSDRAAALQAFAASALRQIPQIDALYVANGAGDFMMVRRGAAGGTATKIIRNRPGARQVSWVYRDTSGRITRIEQTPTDDYDPRARSWYQGALKTAGVFWSGVYIFFTDRAPGVTAAIRFRDQSGGESVFGVDITLKALSGFLASLRIGPGGRAVIIDSTGHLIAAPDTEHLLRGAGDQLAAARVDQLGDKLLTGAYDHFRVEGYGRRLITVNGEPVVSIAARLPAASRNWSLLIVVPEKDFTGFVAADSRHALALSLIVVALAALLAAFLVRQGLRADRTSRLLLDRGRVVERQSAAFAALAREAGLLDPARDGPLRAITETLAELASARRASVWRVTGGGRTLRCEDAYERESAGHVAGLELARAELPQLFAALAAGEPIATDDAANDRRTAELHRVLMHPFDSRALALAPVMAAGGLTGAIMLEDAARLAGARDILPALANILAIRMRGAEAEEPRTAATVAEPAAAQPLQCAERSYAAELVLRGLDSDAIGADVFPAVAVMAIRFSDPAAIAARSATDRCILVERIAEALQEIAEANDIPYMKLVGQEVVAAAGFAPRDEAAILRIADAALAARERCLELFEEVGHAPAFRIGIDYGIAIGSELGRQPRLFNLWGEAVRTADMMASSAAGAGSIQVSEAAYRRLRQQFLFRPRGSFYLPRVGAARTFVLASRL